MESIAGLGKASIIESLLSQPTTELNRADVAFKLPFSFPLKALKIRFI